MASPARSLITFFPKDARSTEDLTVLTKVVNGGSTPPEHLRGIELPNGHPGYKAQSVSDKDATVVDFAGVLPREYAGAGLTIIIHWVSSGATSGNVRVGAAVRRLADDAEAVTDAHTYDYNYVTDAVADAAGEIAYTTITYTDGADMDSLAVGEFFVLRVKRDTSNAADTMEGRMLVLAVDVQETAVA